MPSGRLVAADPFSDTLRKPFIQTLPPGSYDVSITHAELKDHFRSAFAVLTLSDAPIVSWKLLLVPDDKPPEGQPYRYLGYGVDSALGCFCDDEAARLHEKRFKTDDEYREEDFDYKSRGGR